MTKIVTLIIFSILLSCSKNDEPKKTNPLDYQWSLIKVTCECQPINLEVGEHLWTFDTTLNKLYVVNNVTEQLHTLLETGTYDISVTETKVTVLNVEYDYYFENNILFLADQPHSDGPLIKLIKD